MQELLAAGRFIDSNARLIAELAHGVTAGLHGEIDRIVRLYHAVRDSIIYDPYVDVFDQQNYRASSVLATGRGFCIGKSALLAATARLIGVPARVGYADVRNHMTSRRLRERESSSGTPIPISTSTGGGSRQPRYSIRRFVTGLD